MTLFTSVLALSHHMLTNATLKKKLKKKKSVFVPFLPPALQPTGSERERRRPASRGSGSARTAPGGREAKAPELGDEAWPQLLGGVGNVGACGQQTAPHSLSKAASVSGKCHSPACFPAGRSVFSRRLPSPPSPSLPPSPDAGRGTAGWGMVGRAGRRVAMGLGGGARQGCQSVMPRGGVLTQPTARLGTFADQAISSLAPLVTF